MEAWRAHQRRSRFFQHTLQAAVLLAALSAQLALGQSLVRVNTTAGLIQAVRAANASVPTYIVVESHLTFVNQPTVSGSFLRVETDQIVVIRGRCSRPYIGPATFVPPLEPDHCVLDGNNEGRLFFAAPNSSLWLRNLDLVNSRSDLGLNDTPPNLAQAYKSGGAVVSVSGRLYMNSVSVERTYTTASGGGVAITKGGYANLTNVDMDETTAAISGGGFYSDDSESYLDTVKITNTHLDPPEVVRPGMDMFYNGTFISYITKLTHYFVPGGSPEIAVESAATGSGIYTDTRLWKTKGDPSFKYPSTNVPLAVLATTSPAATAWLVKNTPQPDRFTEMEQLLQAPAPLAPQPAPPAPAGPNNNGLFKGWRLPVLIVCFIALVLSLLCICYSCYRIQRLKYERQYNFTTKMLQYDAEIAASEAGDETHVAMPALSGLSGMSSMSGISSMSRDYTGLPVSRSPVHAHADADSSVKLAVRSLNSPRAKSEPMQQRQHSGGLQVHELEMADMSPTTRQGYAGAAPGSPTKRRVLRQGSLTPVFPGQPPSPGVSSPAMRSAALMPVPVSPALAPTRVAAPDASAAPAAAPATPPHAHPHDSERDLPAPAAAGTPPAAVPAAAFSAAALVSATLANGVAAYTPRKSPASPPSDRSDSASPSDHLPLLKPAAEAQPAQQPALGSDGEVHAQRDLLAAGAAAEVPRSESGRVLDGLTPALLRQGPDLAAADEVAMQSNHGSNGALAGPLPDEAWPEADLVPATEEPRRLKYARGGVLDRRSSESAACLMRADPDERAAAAPGTKSPFSNPGGGFKRNERSASLFARKTPGAQPGKLSGRNSRKKERKRMMLNRAETPSASLFAISEEAEIRYTNGGVLYEVPADELSSKSAMSSALLDSTGDIAEGDEEDEADSGSYSDSSDEGDAQATTSSSSAEDPQQDGAADGAPRNGVHAEGGLTSGGEDAACNGIASTDADHGAPGTSQSAMFQHSPRPVDSGLSLL